MIEIHPTRDIETCRLLRRKVFIEEQGVSEEDELDDLDEVATHLLLTEDGAALGSARLLREGGIGKIGRVCVLRQARGRGFGALLIRAAIAEFAKDPALTTVKLGAQTHALGFYQKLGFEAFGPEYLDAGIEHQDMKLGLK